MRKEVMTAVRKLKIFAVMLAVVMILTGCSFRTVSEFYSLPKRSVGYTNLQTVIQSAIGDWEYAAPQSGEYQQTLQSADLDGDGNKEYLLFAKSRTRRLTCPAFVNLPLHLSGGSRKSIRNFHHTNSSQSRR